MKRHIVYVSYLQLIAGLALISCGHDKSIPSPVRHNPPAPVFEVKVPVPPTAPVSVLDGVDEETKNFAFITALHGKLSVESSDWVPTASGIACDRERIVALKKWAGSLNDAQVSQGYMWWLNYYSKELDKKEAELNTHHKSESDEEKRQRELEAKINAGELLGRQKLPKVPNIQCPAPTATTDQLRGAVR